MGAAVRKTVSAGLTVLDNPAGRMPVMSMLSHGSVCFAGIFYCCSNHIGRGVFDREANDHVRFS